MGLHPVDVVVLGYPMYVSRIYPMSIVALNNLLYHMGPHQQPIVGYGGYCHRHL
jgi:hypothetical protein